MLTCAIPWLALSGCSGASETPGAVTDGGAAGGSSVAGVSNGGMTSAGSGDASAGTSQGGSALAGAGVGGQVSSTPMVLGTIFQSDQCVNCGTPFGTWK